ncbi:MAG TPA: response regulator transcription factor [Turneriella sp.]|nr:response regulator transcription factor [Turneriella sp.]
MKTTQIKKNYRIVLVDDHAILRSGIKMLIESKPGLEVVGELSNGQELVTLMKEMPCDMVILDLNMPVMNGIETLGYLQENYPLVKSIVLTTHKEKPFLKRSLSKGAHGYLLKEETHDDLLSAIHDVRQGKRAISKEMTNLIVDDFANDLVSPLSIDLLTQREKEILALTANGQTSKEVGERLEISARTVEAHRAHIREKLGLETHSELVRYAMEHHLI